MATFIHPEVSPEMQPDEIPSEIFSAAMHVLADASLNTNDNWISIDESWSLHVHQCGADLYRLKSCQKVPCEFLTIATWERCSVGVTIAAVA